MIDFLLDWVSLILRWTHIIIGIGWIGTSFYFIWLDQALRRRKGMSEDLLGENWQVHGGGFYHVQKYAVAPDDLPPELHWFKYEAYFTWVTGFLLLGVIYYYSADAFLIDTQVLDLSPGAAIAISVASLVGGWVIYDSICRSPIGISTPLLAFTVFAVILIATILFHQIFSARAAFLHVGAFIGTMMSGNVFFIIIPNQKKTVAALLDKRAPDPALGLVAKQRSLHNNYLTLPVLLMMISNHYPMLFATSQPWLVVALIVISGGLVRHFYNSFDAGERGLAITWQLPAAVLFGSVLVIYVWLDLNRDAVAVDDQPVITSQEAFAIVQLRCASCHAARPTDPDIEEAPGGMAFDTPRQMQSFASRILAQTVLSQTMPLGNKTNMTAEERQRLGWWIRQGAVLDEE